MEQQREASLPNITSLGQMTYEEQEGAPHIPNLRDVPTIDEPRPRSATQQRPWSSQGLKSVLSPSPTFADSARRGSKDDSDIFPHPVTPKRPNASSRGLSLQMPTRDLSSTSTANLAKRIPPSPKTETPTVYPSPTSVLPRRSRGLDFSRAATNLHHSTLAEQSSPESSPVVGGRRGMNIPPRKNLFNPLGFSSFPESPASATSSLWTAMANAERTVLSSSLGSSSVIENESGSSTSDDDEAMDLGEDESTIHMTPNGDGNAVNLINPFAPTDNSLSFSPSASRLLQYQRARLQSRRNRTRKSSSSASGHSSMQSPVPASPPLIRSIENGLNITSGFLLDEPTKTEIASRRESLSLGTSDMQLSDAEQSDDGGNTPNSSHEDIPIRAPVTPGMEDRKHVIRKPVTRRSNLLPKSKGFARVRACLMEEGAPVDTEVRREAEVLRQVREADGEGDFNLHVSQSTTRASSPSLGLATAGPSDGSEQISTDNSASSDDSMRRPSLTAFTSQAARNSGGATFWNTFDERVRTPPPPVFPRDSSSSISEDLNMDGPQSSVQSTPQQLSMQKSVYQDALSSNAQTAITTFDIPRKGTKRMREDDFDSNYFKRRAVSPGLSVQNSPVLPQSPGWWGTSKREREGSSVSISGDRVNSTGSTGSVSGSCGGSKRVGIQGMNDTNDGLMNMSIE